MNRKIKNQFAKVFEMEDCTSGYLGMVEQRCRARYGETDRLGTLCDLRSLSRGCGYCGGFGGGGGSALERMSVVEANKKGEEFVSS